MLIYKKQTEALNEKGFASIVIALILIIVLSLITIGFASLARREQQTSLNKQLATQANYAAESGINDAIKAIPQIEADSNVNPKKCLSETSPLLLPNSNISNTQGVSYTCVLVDVTPPSLVKTGLSPNNSWNTSFSTTSTINSLTIEWASNDQHTSAVPSGKRFLPSASWNANKYTSVLQLSITPLNPLSRDNLIKNMFTAYLFPSASGTNSTTYSTNPAQQAPIIGTCSAGTCKATIQSLSGTGPYLVHVVNYYDESNITITAGGPSAQPEFVNAQGLIDVTGKARNVLKRLQVHVPLGNSLNLPNYAVEGQDVCKRLSTAPDGTTFDPTPCDNTP